MAFQHVMGPGLALRCPVKMKTAAGGEDVLRMKIFNGKGDDFSLWSVRISAILEARDLLELVKGDEKKPNGSSSERMVAFTPGRSDRLSRV